MMAVGYVHHLLYVRSWFVVFVHWWLYVKSPLWWRIVPYIVALLIHTQDLCAVNYRIYLIGSMLIA